MLKKIREYYHRASLKGKLSVTTFFLFLFIFTIVTILAYASMNYILLNHERDTLQTNSQKLSTELSEIDKELTLDNLSDYLYTHRDSDVVKVQESIREHHIFREMRDLSSVLISTQQAYIYSSQKRLIFTTDSEKNPPTLQYIGDIYQTAYSNVKGYVLTKPIYAKSNSKKIIGYIQIFQNLQVYYNLRNRVFFFLVIMEIFILIIGQLVIVEFSRRFLSPVHTLNASMREVVKNPSDLSKRVEIHTGDEIESLAHIYNQMLERLSEQNDRQVRFISDISHELRTPIAVIKGHLDLLQRWGKNDPEILEESLEVSSVEINRMNIMINDMLEMVRITGSFEQHQNDTCIVQTSSAAIVGNFKGLHPDFDITLSDQMAQPIMIKMYKNHFEQALTILMDNAVKYSRDKKVIDLSIDLEDQYALIRVKDQGEGISKEDLQHIFERFYRSDKSRHRVSTQAGLGIGLSILSEIVEAYHCQIDVVSEVDKGTEFMLRIPIVRENDH